VEAARRTIAEFQAGAFELADGDEATPAAKPLPLAAPVFSPDRAALWSFALTPVFGASLQLMNSWAIGERSARVRDAAWLVVLTLLTVVSVLTAHRLNPGPFVVLRASFVTSALTVIWYFIALQPRSKELVEAHGRTYPKRPMLLPALGAFALALVVGWVLEARA
ncbi:MAG TPA: hypothetical protein VGQ91_17810, partial [Ideonella sp.]|nr:hypothetical protein [Ideonella sp.]